MIKSSAASEILPRLVLESKAIIYFVLIFI